MTTCDRIIDSFVKNQNDTDDLSQKNLFSREQYMGLMYTVLEVLNENKDANLSELREALYKRSGLEDLLCNFIYKKKKAPGVVLSFGTPSYQEKIVIGNQEEVALDPFSYKSSKSTRAMNEDTFFDLSGVTQLFTSVSVLQLAGEGQLVLSDKVSKYLPHFTNLGDINIFDLLTYVPLKTDIRVDSVDTIQEAEEILSQAHPVASSVVTDRYNDIAPMVLKYVVEKVSGLPFAQYVKNNILDVAGMNNTFVRVPSLLAKNIASCNYEYILADDGSINVRDYIVPTAASDLKALALGQLDGVLSGHAGLFSCSDDMTLFGKGLIDGTILDSDLVKEMAKNRTGSPATINPYYGFLCESKYPCELFSDLHPGLSGRAFSKSGWTGTYFAVDPVNHINFSYLSNRVHNRFAIVSGLHKAKFSDGFFSGRRTLKHDGKRIIDASLYSFDRRRITNACLELAIQERMLEELVGIKDVPKEEVISLTRHL